MVRSAVYTRYTSRSEERDRICSNSGSKTAGFLRFICLRKGGLFLRASHFEMRWIYINEVNTGGIMLYSLNFCSAK
jgi:hypothetical protein